MKTTVKSFLKHCASQFIQSFQVHTTVYQQKQTGQGAHLAYSKMDTVSLWWGHIGWCVALAIHQNLAPRLKEVYSYSCTPPFGHHDLFHCEPYILAARRVRRSLFQYIM